MPRGPVKLITVSDLAKIKQLAGLGLTTREIANFFQMSPDTFYVRCRENPEILRTIEEGKTEAKKNLLAKSYLKAIGGKPQDPNSGDNDMLKWLLARVHGMSEKQIIEHRMRMQEENLTIDELEERIKELEEKESCPKLVKASNDP